MTVSRLRIGWIIEKLWQATRVYLEIVDFFASGTTPQMVAEFQPSPAAQQRALDLLDLAKQDQLTPEQESALDHFVELEHILRMAKAKARQTFATQQ